MSKRRKFELKRWKDGKIKSKNFFSPKTVTGKLTVNARGFGFVTPDDGGEDIFIAAENINRALHGDAVKIKIVDKFGKKREGEVVEIIEHALARKNFGSHPTTKNLPLKFPLRGKMTTLIICVR